MVLWAASGERIGMGHVMQCLSLAKAAERLGMRVTLTGPEFKPAEDVVVSAGVQYEACAGSLVERVEGLRDPRPTALMVNDHTPDSGLFGWAKQLGIPCCWINQWDIRHDNAPAVLPDIIANGWPGSHYTGPEGPTTLYGLNYALLNPALETVPCPKRGFSAASGEILVSMGGVDRTHVTLKVAEALLDLPTGWKATCIAGPGFGPYEDLERIAAESSALTALKAPSDFLERLAGADMLISAGGVTLCEAATLGTPALTLWEDPHEEKAGLALSSQGIGRVVGCGAQLSRDGIKQAIQAAIEDPFARRAWSNAGQTLFDGGGAARILNALVELKSRQD